MDIGMCGSCIARAAPAEPPRGAESEAEAELEDSDSSSSVSDQQSKRQQ